MNRRAASLPTIFVALLCLSAGSVLAKSSDRNQQLKVSADSNDCSMDESRPCLFNGNVHIVQGTLDIVASKADVRRGGNQQVIKLSGSPVKMKQQMDDGGWVNATAAQIDYDQNRDTVVFSGNAVVKQPGRGSISGERIVYNMATGQVQSGAAAGGSGRVNMTFEPKNQAPAKDAKPEPKAEPAQQDEN
jgi:lipopolysaccharide export system protein LptA